MKHRRDNTNRTSAERKRRGRRWVTVLCVVPLIVGAAMTVYAFSKPSHSTSSPAPGSSSRPGVADGTPALRDALPEKVVGRWSRPDGDYVLEIRSVGADGEAQAAYFNPQQIHVAQAKVSRESGSLRVYVELRDVNYPGSTYRLVYDPAGDCLQGTYYQAVAKETYDIFFVRLKT